MSSPSFIGKYKVIKELGAGGFGAVYLAQDPRLKENVAIKVFKLRDAELARQATSATSEAGKVLHERFLNEAKILRQLSSNPHIVDVYEFDEMDDGTPYYIMPYLEQSLVDEIGKDALTTAALEDIPPELHPRRLNVQRSIQVITQILTGLAEVHNAGLVHRDIKPANILFDKQGRAQLCDFGIAKSPDVQHSQSGMAMGSRNYMSPEQRESAKHVKAQSDVYSVGVLAYRMLTGTLPIGRFDDPIAHSPSIGEELNTLILQAMDNVADNRPHDARELLAKLKHAAKQIDSTAPEYSEDTSTDIGQAPQQVRDQLKPLSDQIEKLLLEYGELSSDHLRQLSMMASIVELDEAGLNNLIQTIEKRLSPKIKPLQNFIKLIKQELEKTNGQLTEQTKEELINVGSHLELESKQLVDFSERYQS